MTTENQVLNWIREGLVSFSDELSGYRVILFGSRARGNHQPRSDFDIGIIGDHPVPLKTFFKISDFLENLPTLYRIDWVDLNRAEAALRNQALSKAEVLYG
mgnify:CR=1 FL=1